MSFLDISYSTQTLTPTTKPITTLPTTKSTNQTPPNSPFPILQTSGNNYYYVFDKPGSYSISFTNNKITDISYLVVGGGGGSSGTYGANGGSIQSGTLSDLSNNKFTLVVGKGGEGSNSGDYSCIINTNTNKSDDMYASGGKGTDQKEDVSNNKYSLGGDGCNGENLADPIKGGDTKGSKIKYTLIPGIKDQKLTYNAGLGGLGISSSYFEGKKIGIGGIKSAGGGGGPIHVNELGEIIKGFGSDGGGTYGSGVNATYGGGGAGSSASTTPTPSPMPKGVNPSRGGDGVIVIQYTSPDSGSTKTIVQAASSDDIGCSSVKGCGTLGFTDKYAYDQFEIKEGLQSMPEAKTWLPFPIDDENCEYCSGIKKKDLYFLIKTKIVDTFKSSKPTTPGDLNSVSLFDVLNHSITVSDTCGNSYTYKPLQDSLEKSIKYDGTKMEINTKDTIWTRKLPTVIQENDDQGSNPITSTPTKKTNPNPNPSTGSYPFDYQTINNSAQTILVYYDCSAAHENYYIPHITVDGSGNYKLTFDENPSYVKAGDPHIHVKQYTYTDASYNGYSPTAIMDFFIRTYPTIGININNNLPNMSGNDDNNGGGNPFRNDGVDTKLLAEDIVELIAQYYFALCYKKQKTDHYNKIVSTNMAADPLYENNVDEYNRAYQNVVNMSAGIVAAIAFIYLVTSTTK
jgi:hypothetical protein